MKTLAATLMHALYNLVLLLIAMLSGAGAGRRDEHQSAVRRSRSHRATRTPRRLAFAVRLFLFSAICSPKLARSSMAQIFSARAPVIDLLPKRHHLPEPVVTSARGESERVARFPN
jgi:hypothetical protein